MRRIILFVSFSTILTGCVPVMNSASEFAPRQGGQTNNTAKLQPREVPSWALNGCSVVVGDGAITIVARSRMNDISAAMRLAEMNTTVIYAAFLNSVQGELEGKPHSPNFTRSVSGVMAVERHWDGGKNKMYILARVPKFEISALERQYGRERVARAIAKHASVDPRRCQ